jgi:hypothetical protein
VLVAPAPPPPGSSLPPQWDPQTHRPTPTAVYVSGALTLGLAVGAGITSALYLRDNGEKDADSVRQLGYVNLGFWAGAAIGAGLTSYLYFSRPERPTSARTLLAPWIDGSGAGLMLQTTH